MDNYLTISELIGMVQDELIKAQEKREEAGKAPLFRTDELELEMNTELTTGVGGKMILGIPVLSVNMSAKDNEKSTQKIKLKFKVVENNDGIDFLPEQGKRVDGRLPKLEE